MGDALGWITGVGGTLAGIGNTVGSLATMGYNMWAQKKQWKREDNAMQRRVADLRAAGLSPTLAAGGPGAPTSTKTLEAPTIENPAVGILNYLGVKKMQGDITQTDMQNNLLKLQAESLMEDIKFKKEFNPERIEEKTIKNDFLNATMESRVKMVQELLNTQEKVTLLKSLEGEMKRWEQDTRLPVVAELAARVVERAQKLHYGASRINSNDARILYLSAVREYLIKAGNNQEWQAMEREYKIKDKGTSYDTKRKY